MLVAYIDGGARGNPGPAGFGCYLQDANGKCVAELNAAMERQGWANKTTLSDTEKVYVAIAYNTGRANPALGFKQGYRSDDGKYYGENIVEYLALAQSISPRGVGSTATSVAVTGPGPSVSAMPEKPHPLLTLGDGGDEVKVLQALLQSQGFFAAAVLGHFQLMLIAFT